MFSRIASDQSNFSDLLLGPSASFDQLLELAVTLDSPSVFVSHATEALLARRLAKEAVRLLACGDEIRLRNVSIKRRIDGSVSVALRPDHLHEFNDYAKRATFVRTPFTRRALL